MLTPEIDLLLFFYFLRCKHQNKIFPQEDGPLEQRLLCQIEQFIQSAALGLKSPRTSYSPSLSYYSCGASKELFSERILASQMHFECHERAEETSIRCSTRQEQKTNFAPGLWFMAPSINTGSFVKVSSFYLRWNPTLIAGKAINRPHLIMEVSLSKLSWKSQLIGWVKRMVFFKGKTFQSHFYKVAKPAFCSFPLY